jgi:integrase
MIMFNDILRLEGLDPETVRLVRHGSTQVSLYEIWRTDPQLLEGYQAIQSRNVFNAGDKLASFVVTPHPRRETLFVGYDARHTFASWAIAGNVQLFYLARIMGTSVQQIDQTYGHLLPDSEDYLRGLLDSFDARQPTAFAQSET